MMDEIERIVSVIAEYEGLTIQEAKLSYAARQRLPDSAFCGPDRSYPAHDAAHVRNAFARLSKFGKKLSKPIAKRIYRCLVKRAKKYGVEHDPDNFRWLLGKKSVEETCAEVEEEEKKLIEWALKEYGIE